MEENKNVKKKTLIIMVIGVIIGLVICFVIAYNNVKLSENQNNNDNSNNSKALTSSKSDSKNMNITSGGSYDLSGEYESVTINTKEEVTLNLNGVEITNSNGPGINVVEAELVIITLSEENKISSTTTEDLDGAIYSKADLVFSGTGSLEVKSNYDGIVSKGDIIINGGKISVTGQSTFDYDGTGTINGGTVICNGEEVTTLPNQFMGGGMKGGNFKPMNQDGEQEGERPQIPFNNENMNDENRTQMPPK